MTRSERAAAILAVVVAASVSIATKPRRTGWRSPATPIPHALRLTPERPEAVVSYRAQLNAAARGQRNKGNKLSVAARDIDVRVTGSATWLGVTADAQPAAVRFFVATPSGARTNEHRVTAEPGTTVPFTFVRPVHVDPLGTRCPMEQACPVEFEVDVRWTEPSAGRLDVEWTMTAEAFGPTHARRDSKPPEGARITVKEIRPE